MSQIAGSDGNRIDASTSIDNISAFARNNVIVTGATKNDVITSKAGDIVSTGIAHQQVYFICFIATNNGVIGSTTNHHLKISYTRGTTLSAYLSNINIGG